MIFVGYPIWHGIAPRILYTFIESYDFAGKTIIPFCTSGSSGIDLSIRELEALTEGVNWTTGRRFSGSASEKSVTDWVDSVLPDTDNEAEKTNSVYLYINENKIEVTLVENSSVDILLNILKQEDITYTANDYGNFEKVGDIGHTLPRNDENIDTSAGM